MVSEATKSPYGINNLGLEQQVSETIYSVGDTTKDVLSYEESSDHEIKKIILEYIKKNKEEVKSFILEYLNIYIGEFYTENNWLTYKDLKPNQFDNFYEDNQEKIIGLIELGFDEDWDLYDFIKQKYLELKYKNSQINNIYDNKELKNKIKNLNTPNIEEINKFLNGGNLENIDIKNINIYFTKLLTYNELRKRENKNKLEEEIYSELSSDILFSTFTNEDNPDELKSFGKIANGFNYNEKSENIYEIELNIQHIINNPEYIEIVQILSDFDLREGEIIGSNIIYEIGEKGIEYLKYYTSILEKIAFFEDIRDFSIIKQNNYFKKIDHNFDLAYWEDKGENSVLDFLITNSNLENLQGDTIKEKLKNTIVTYSIDTPNSIRKFSINESIIENTFLKTKLENDILKEKERLKYEKNLDLEPNKKRDILIKEDNTKIHEYTPLINQQGLGQLFKRMYNDKNRLNTLEDIYFNNYNPEQIKKRRKRKEERYDKMSSEKLKERLNEHINDRVYSYIDDIYDLYKENYDNKDFLNYIYDSLYNMLYNETYKKIHFFNVSRKEVGTLFEIEKDKNTIYLGGFNSIKNLKLGFTLFKEVVKEIGEEKNIELEVALTIGEEINERAEFLIKKYSELGFEIIGEEGEKRNEDGSLAYKYVEMKRKREIKGVS